MSGQRTELIKGKKENKEYRIIVRCMCTKIRGVMYRNTVTSVVVAARNANLTAEVFIR
jgi:hypothetical protein